MVGDVLRLQLQVHACIKGRCLVEGSLAFPRRAPPAYFILHFCIIIMFVLAKIPFSLDIIVPSQRDVGKQVLLIIQVHRSAIPCNLPILTPRSPRGLRQLHNHIVLSLCGVILFIFEPLVNNGRAARAVKGRPCNSARELLFTHYITEGFLIIVQLGLMDNFLWSIR